ncbi:spermine synthase [Ixodes scapularis]|uniref:spermine synthase n=1 Tax=Ixodes scapularis TaxID=6945 RepID=UPI001AD75903|nr:spermine synthase [Ixodes scapularis]
MAVRTAMMDVWLDQSVTDSPGSRSSAVQSVEDVLSTLSLVRRHDQALVDSHLYLYTADSERLSCIINLYSTGFLTVTIEDGNPNSPLTNQVMEELKLKIKDSIKTRIARSELCSLQCEARPIPLIKRGTTVPNYYTTSDERILEYDFDKIVFEENSKYQHVKILHSPTLGNCLLLDDLQNLAEKDISYTHGLMKYRRVSYTDKEILILGGGDGGLLCELLKENPKYVTMVDIDEMVINACRIHLRGACGDVLDTLKGNNYEIIIDDCVKKMQQYIGEGRTFDIVFNDLTDIPISTEPQGEHWDFVKKIVTMGLQVLKTNGLFLNHAIGISCTSALETYEELLTKLPFKVEFSKHSEHVPSFMEDWVFYEVKKLE